MTYGPILLAVVRISHIKMHNTRQGDFLSARSQGDLFRLLGECVSNLRSGWHCKFLRRFLLIILSLGEGECRQSQADKEGIVEPEMGRDVFLVREGGDLLFGGVLGKSEQS